jgi:hypothetical protein
MSAAGKNRFCQRTILYRTACFLVLTGDGLG